MSAYAVQGSGDRWFWCYWQSGNPNDVPTKSGYAKSKDEALAAIRNIDPNAEQQLAGCAKQWRGVLHCKHCGSDQFEVGNGQGQHFARLRCCACGRWNKWISEEQYKVLEQRWAGRGGAA